VGIHRGLPIWSKAGERAVERTVHRRAEGGVRSDEPDFVVAEEPLELRIEGESLLVTMRTPGDDLDLAAGLLFTEGVIRSLDEIVALEEGRRGTGAENTVNVKAARQLEVATARRVLRATAACGLCGKETIADVRRRIDRMTDETRVPLSIVLSLPDAIRAAQPVFAATGGLHAVGLFSLEGTPLVVREDVGRHNAVDKVIGARLRAGQSLSGTIMLLSGRAGFELVQKAAVARVPVVCSVSAPSALAVDLANEVGMTLVGFVRGRSANVYTHPRRII
jgi:FdhD protein